MTQHNDEMLRNPNLRVGDLVAKTARVTLKDTMRALLSLQALSAATGRTTDELLSDMVIDTTRARPENVAACELAHYELKDMAKHNHDVKRTLRNVSELV